MRECPRRGAPRGSHLAEQSVCAGSVRAVAATPPRCCPRDTQQEWLPQRVGGQVDRQAGRCLVHTCMCVRPPRPVRRVPGCTGPWAPARSAALRDVAGPRAGRRVWCSGIRCGDRGLSGLGGGPLRPGRAQGLQAELAEGGPRAGMQLPSDHPVGGLDTGRWQGVARGDRKGPVRARGDPDKEGRRQGGLRALRGAEVGAGRGQAGQRPPVLLGRRGRRWSPLPGSEPPLPSRPGAASGCFHPPALPHGPGWGLAGPPASQSGRLGPH